MVFIFNSSAIDAVFIYVSVLPLVVYTTHILTHDIILWYTNKNLGKELSITTVFSNILLYSILRCISTLIKPVIRHIQSIS